VTRYRTIVVCGGRTYQDAARIRSTIEEYVPADGGELPTIHQGGSRGADTLAASEAQDMGLPVISWPAAWQQYGRAAGPIRNRAMLDAGPDLVIAFGGGKGTDDCVREARRRGIEVREEARL